MILVTLLSLGSVWLNAQGPGSGVGHSVGAGSPFNGYVLGVAIFCLLIGAMVAVLLLGAWMVISFGFLSKRAEDRVGGRTPGELGLLKTVVWPESPYEKSDFPAEDEEDSELRHRAG